MFRSEGQLQEMANLAALGERQSDVHGWRFGDQAREYIGDFEVLRGQDTLKCLGVSRGWQRRAVIDECVDELLPGRRILEKDNQVDRQFALLRPHRIRVRHFIQSISRGFWVVAPRWRLEC